MLKTNMSKQIKDLQIQVCDLENKWKRAVADYCNLEKRIGEERVDFVKYANAKLVDKFLPVLDDLERAVGHFKEKGLGLILNQFKGVLNSEGVEEIKAEGEVFDPLKMDCIEMGKGPKNQVIEVIQKGYSYQGKVLRPAKVRVGKGEKC